MSVPSIFDGLKKQDIASIVDVGVIRPFSAGEVIFSKGDIGCEMFVVLTGKILIVDQYGGVNTAIAELESGELFGEMAMFDDAHIRSTHAFAKEPSQLLVLSEVVLYRMLQRKMPRKFLINIITILCHRLRKTNHLYMEARFQQKVEQTMQLE